LLARRKARYNAIGPFRSVQILEFYTFRDTI
jgi:hypothetical protein